MEQCGSKLERSNESEVETVAKVDETEMSGRDLDKRLLLTIQ